MQELVSRYGEQIRYLLVGGAVTLFYVAVAMALQGMGWPHGLASVIACVASVVPSYLAQRSITFRSDAKHSDAFVRFVVLQPVYFAIAALLPDRIVGLAPSVPSWAVFGSVSALIAVVNFCVLKVWVMR